MKKKRILSGMRSTGKLHLGNLFGALNTWKNLQGKYESFFFVADWHALTSDYANTGHLKNYIHQMVIDWLSVGISPDESTLFVQSHIKEHAELFLLLSTITPLAWLERNPTYKEQKEQLINKDISTFGFLGYPVLQAADIIIYKAEGVPVGVDQLPHIELTREIARRFNYFYGDIFPIPEPILADTPKIFGIDRRKMSKSYDNAIYLSENPDIIKKKVAQMVTDPQRARACDPGDPGVCNVYNFHKLLSGSDTVERIDSECRTALIRCVECKRIMAENLSEFLAPVRERHDYYEARPDLVEEILKQGEIKARGVAQETIEQVRTAVKI
ncbi:MAG: tryptophan--tRNA ligase [Pseudomonadota bacterium]